MNEVIRKATEELEALACDLEHKITAWNKDLPGVAVADRFVARHEGKYIVHEPSEVPVGVVVEQFGAGYRQRQRSLGFRAIAAAGGLVALGLGFSARHSLLQAGENSRVS